MQASKQSKSNFEPATFLLRQNLRFWRLADYRQLRDWEKAFWIIIGREEEEEEEEARIKLDETGERELLSALRLEKLGSMAAFKWQQNQSLNDRISTSADFLNRLRRLIIDESRYMQAHLERFESLYSALGDSATEVLWLKGPGLASMVYPQNELRLSGDFDIMALNDKLAIEVESALITAKFTSDLAARTQTGAAPANRMEEVCLQPTNHFVCCDALVFRNDLGVLVELKLDPFDRGLRMITTDKLESQAVWLTYRGRDIRCPGLEDQLLIACVHLRKDHFLERRRILDIALIVEAFNRSQFDWGQFTQRCRQEGISDEVWIALELTKNRLGCKVPDTVLIALKPSSRLAPWLSFTVSARFLWNQNSLPMLLIQTAVANDRKRKLEALLRTCLPDRAFLLGYYANNRNSIIPWPFYLLMHWFVLLMPSAVIKRTLGTLIWKPPTARCGDSCQII